MHVPKGPIPTDQNYPPIVYTNQRSAQSARCALADYTEGIRLDPKHAHAYYRRGWAYGKKGEFDKAIADYTEQIRLDPKHADAYYGRGYAYRQKGEAAKAEEDFAQAKKLGYKAP
jgi:tetratricopeptide (TPR) repeat protein